MTWGPDDSWLPISALGAALLIFNSCYSVNAAAFASGRFRRHAMPTLTTWPNGEGSYPVRYPILAMHGSNALWRTCYPFWRQDATGLRAASLRAGL